MWLNYLRLSWRQILNKKHLSILKIVGLGLGIAVSILLMKYISWQWHFDRFHASSKQIVRVRHDHLGGGALNSRSAITASGVGVLAKEMLPAVKNYVRLGPWIANDVVFRNGENLYRGKKCYFADPSFFEVFSFELLQGDSRTALQDPNRVVLTESTAELLFGAVDPMGKELLFENRFPFMVAGIVKDPPVQSHLQFEILGSLETMTNWGFKVYGDNQLEATYTYTYLELDEQANHEELAAELTEVVSKMKPNESGSDQFIFQPLERIHLYSQLENELQATGQGNTIWILASIAILILFLGWVNHFNLFTADLLDNAPVISIRKIIGAGRRQIFTQIAVTGTLYALLGIVLGFAIVFLMEGIVERTFHIPFNNYKWQDIEVTDPAFYLLLIFLTGTLMTIVFPAFLFSKISPKELIRRKLSLAFQGFNFRKVLVTFQFIVIITLIACTGTIYKQTQSMQVAEIGLDINDVLAIRAPLGVKYEDLALSFPRFKQVIESFPEITNLSASHHIPGNQLELVKKVKFNNRQLPISFYRNYGDPGFFKLYNIPFLARDTAISQNNKDIKYVVINKLAADLMGFNNPEEALRQRISYWEREYEIVGVTENYFQRSVHHPVVPILYNYSSDGIMADGYFSLKTKPGKYSPYLLESIKEAYTTAFPYTVFDPIDVEAHFASQYEPDNQFKHLNLGFTLLAIIIACFGLIGLMMITIEKKSKELSIRKILGASIGSLMLLLSRDYISMVFIAGFIALPLSWILMDKWLSNFAIQIDMPWWIFLGSTVLALLVALMAIGYHSIKVTLINPVETLKEE